MGTTVQQTHSGEIRLTIDKNRLDVEWEEQAIMFFVQGQKLAEAQREHDRAKAVLSLKEAQLDKEIRENSDEFFGEDSKKPTETQIKNAVVMQPEYQALEKKVIDAKYDLNIADKAITALEHRKRALTLLTELYFKDYWVKGNSRTASGGMSDSEKESIRTRGARRREEESSEDNEDE